MILAIETSCDDTSVALVEADGFVRGMLSANQDLQHAPFGGIVPEIASRNHTFQLLPLIEKLLQQSQMEIKDLKGIAVTNRPGLVGSLIVGLVTAKTLSQIYHLPLIGINHLEGHILAPFAYDENFQKTNLEFPYIALAVSGGHTSIYHVKGLGQYQILGATLDDAAGEAFDKFAKLLGLGFPGGVKVDQLSQNGDTKKYSFPRGLIDEDHLQMSFSGLKSAAARLLQHMSKDEIEMNKTHLCASFQEAVVEALLAKLDLAVTKSRLKNVVITGGVSANSRLRSLGNEWAQKKKLNLYIPPLRYCTDNAAMIGVAGYLRILRGEKHNLDLGPSPQIWSEDFISGNMQKGRKARVKSPRKT